MKKYNVVIASDHNGFNLKSTILNYLAERNIATKDLGTASSETTVDYPDFAEKLVGFMHEEDTPFGILICGTGIGMSIAANRSSKIRAALCTSPFMAERARLHNNANILVLGAKITDEKLSLEMVGKFLDTQFEGGRHSTRLDKIR